jgi:hypothetical protein
VPHFIVFSESEGLDSDSWMVQCEILQHNLLGAGPPIEDLVPKLPVGDGAPFAFFGLGQQGAGPVKEPQEPEHVEELWATLTVSGVPLIFAYQKTVILSMVFTVCFHLNMAQRSED